MTAQPRAGEMLVGAYLKLIEECEIVAYGQHSPLEGEQIEVDVIGVQPSGDREVVTCEVATHLRGLGYGTAEENGDRVAAKFENAERYVDRVFGPAETHRFQFWSPNVPPASEAALREVATDFGSRNDSELELVVNDEYADRVEELRAAAASTYAQRNELAFRFLQILEHVRE
ncbi:hypothetical protein Hbl1158_13550 [Halobaculum sp. CBA1158]|uniref:hypothetical protein n=1 Tax=Halobaculum sp. CBA1158 TaxID=2904243 RepID=UPI001F306FBF|nr:hypothetical protein [Halobaculum sp. CBA1158]UIO99533.1 hypothetical protein Hbl1158_13550 [Halobaculum sp. CBA1158]